jgi:uncharacterized membrane protein
MISNATETPFRLAEGSERENEYDILKLKAAADPADFNSRDIARKETSMSTEKPKTGTGLDQNVAGLLCYVLWWVTGIVFLILEKDNKTIKFHAWQSIFTFAAITVVQIILAFIPFVGWILGIIVWLLSVILWILLMVKAYQGQMWKVPIAGNIAAKQAGV